MAEQDIPEGMARIPFVTQFAVRATHGFVLLALNTTEPTEDFVPLELEQGLEPEQAIELGKVLQEYGYQCLRSDDFQLP